MTWSARPSTTRSPPSCDVGCTPAMPYISLPLARSGRGRRARAGRDHRWRCVQRQVMVAAAEALVTTSAADAAELALHGFGMLRPGNVMAGTG